MRTREFTAISSGGLGGEGTAKDTRGAATEATQRQRPRAAEKCCDHAGRRRAQTSPPLPTAAGDGKRQAGGGATPLIPTRISASSVSAHRPRLSRLLPSASEAARKRSASSACWSPAARRPSELFGQGPEGVFSEAERHRAGGLSCVFGIPRLDFPVGPVQRPQVPFLSGFSPGLLTNAWHSIGAQQALAL